MFEMKSMAEPRECFPLLTSGAWHVGCTRDPGQSGHKALWREVVSYAGGQRDGHLLAQSWVNQPHGEITIACAKKYQF